MVLEKTLESPLDCKEIHLVHPKGDQSWVFIGGTDVETETPVLWPPHVKSWLLGKDSDAGRDCGWEEKGTTEDEMAGWHHRLDGHEFEWTPWAGDGQGGLTCCDSWGRKQSDMTERLNWTELKIEHKVPDSYDFTEIYNKYLKKNNINSIQTFLESWRGWNTFKLIKWERSFIDVIAIYIYNWSNLPEMIRKPYIFFQ